MASRLKGNRHAHPPPHAKSAIMSSTHDLPAADRAAIERAAALVGDADAIVIAAGTAFMDIASPAAFFSDPRRAWGFYGHRLHLYRRTVPHAGYALLRKWGEARRHGYFVFTSNVDGHFQKAGFDPRRIDECHGSIHRLQCLLPCTTRLWPAAGVHPAVDAARCELLGPLPACPHCGGIARPNILMFDDDGWIGDARELQAMRCQGWLEQVRRPLVIELGAGLNIPTVRHFAHRVVRRHGGSLLRINPREAHTGGLAGIGIAGTALATLAAIDAVLDPS
jgi:NAD-dependent SIR2 family protein deacetylase